MNRRQFSRILKTTAVSLGGGASAVADAAAQDTDPLHGENVTISLGNTTVSFDRARLAFEAGTMQFRGRNWTLEGGVSTLQGNTVRVTVDDVSADTYVAVRSGMSDTFDSHSPFPLLTGVAQAGVNPDASVRVAATPVEQDGHVVADRITATGRFGTIVPTGLGGLGDATTRGPSKWRQMTVTRSSTELVFDDVTITTASQDTTSVQGPRFTLTFGTITQDGETLTSNFETSGTLAELLRILPTTDTDADVDVDTSQLPKQVIVSSDTETLQEYVFEVTGDLEKLEPNEDVNEAVDEVMEVDDRVRVEGAVSTGDDRFAFSGDLIEIDIPSEVNLEITDR